MTLELTHAAMACRTLVLREQEGFSRSAQRGTKFLASRDRPHASAIRTGRTDRRIRLILEDDYDVYVYANCSPGQVRLASPRREGTRTWSAIQSSIRFAS